MHTLAGPHHAPVSSTALSPNLRSHHLSGHRCRTAHESDPPFGRVVGANAIIRGGDRVNRSVKGWPYEVHAESTCRSMLQPGAPSAETCLRVTQPWVCLFPQRPASFRVCDSVNDEDGGSAPPALDPRSCTAVVGPPYLASPLCPGNLACAAAARSWLLFRRSRWRTRSKWPRPSSSTSRTWTPSGPRVRAHDCHTAVPVLSLLSTRQALHARHTLVGLPVAACSCSCLPTIPVQLYTGRTSTPPCQPAACNVLLSNLARTAQVTLAALSPAAICLPALPAQGV